MVAIKQLWGPISGLAPSSSGTITTFLMNDAVKSAVGIYMVPKDGIIDRICIPVSAVTGTPSMRLILSTLSGGNASGTPYGGSAAKDVSAWSTGWQEITLDTPATVAAGDTIGVAFWPSGSANIPDPTNHNITIRSRVSLLAQSELPAYQEWITAWTKTTTAYPLITARYSAASGGDYLGYAIASTQSGLATVSINTGTTPDEVGNLVQLPADKTCYGARVTIKHNAVGADIQVKLYDNSNNLLASATIDADNVTNVGTLNTLDVYWDPVNLTANTNYRISVLPTTATSVQIMDILTPNNTNGRASIPEGSRWQKISRTDANSSWTTDDTSVVPMGLWLSDITVGGGGGTTNNIFMVQE
jgi:hypothetical protein